MFKFLGSVVDEMKQVTWPTKKELRKYSLTVFGMVIIFAIYFFAVDSGIRKLLSFFIG